jgi:hypothetical protein
MARLRQRSSTEQDLEKIAHLTLEHYDQRAEEFWEGTRNHDVGQNIAALLQYIDDKPPFTILDFGCGPGRDLKVFAELGWHLEEGHLRRSQRPFHITAQSLCCRRQPLKAKDLSMKPEHEMRRKIIREWMSLPKDKRQTEEQAKPFAKKAMERIPSSGDPYRQIMGWLLPRIGKA